MRWLSNFRLCRWFAVRYEALLVRMEVRDRPSLRVGNFRLGLESLVLEATVKVYGVAVAMPQG